MSILNTIFAISDAVKFVKNPNSFMNNHQTRSFKVGNVDIDSSCYDTEIKESMIDGCSKNEAEINALNK